MEGIGEGKEGRVGEGREEGREGEPISSGLYVWSYFLYLWCFNRR